MIMTLQEISKWIEEYTIKFNSISSILSAYPLSECTKLFDQYPPLTSYKYISADVANLIKEIRKRSNEAIVQLYNQLLLIYCMREAIIKLDSSNFPPNIKSLFHVNFRRIINDIVSSKAPQDFYRFSNDKFTKDLGVCTLRLIPAGFAKVHLSRFPLNCLFTHGVHQLIHVLRFVVFELGGVQPLYQQHWDSHDSNLTHEFSPQGWERFYRNIADLLKINEDVKGAYGVAWFHDPRLKSISPRLSFLHEFVPQHGGKIFNMGAKDHAVMDAIVKSPTRRKLYEEGKYLPTNYISVWSRKKLIRWATRCDSFCQK